ncbi:hypothetical protein Tco_0748753 [Tanacetum coccineum]|uniref:Uncharacterized protein n=1 Tax=Tanacetum coccineum TaxID=301880 RepID=A0ABQ4YZH0_9ASTR
MAWKLFSPRRANEIRCRKLLKMFNVFFSENTEGNQIELYFFEAWGGDIFLEIKHAQFEDVQELLNKLVDDVQNVNEELAEYTNTPSWNLPNSSYDDDDDEESSIPLKDIIIHRDTLMASPPKIDFLLDEFAGELTRLQSIPPGIDNINLDPEGDILEEIDILHGPDDSIPPGIKSDDFDSEDDDNSTSLPEFESFHVDYPDSGDSTIDVVGRKSMDFSDCDDSRARGFCPSFTLELFQSSASF